MELKEVVSSIGYKMAATLFKEYAIEIGIDLEFQNFDQEIANIGEQYTRPEGAIFIAYANKNMAVGCTGVRKLDDDICELKRMYIRKTARGGGIAHKLLEKAITVAIVLGYSKMRLDTLSSMVGAIHIYEKAGFYEIAPYRFNPISGAKFYELELKG